MSRAKPSFRDFFEEFEAANPSKPTTCGVCTLDPELLKEVNALITEGKQRSQIARALRKAGRANVTDHTMRHHAKNHNLA